METIKQTSTEADLELLAFRIGDQEYSVDIMKVREIRGWTPATPLPHSPEFVCGVINLRGAVLPIIDLSARLGLGAIAPTTRNVIIVIQINMQTIGVLVDAVSDILTISKGEIQPPPSINNYGEQKFINGLTISDDRMIRILSLEGLMPEKNPVAA